MPHWESKLRIFWYESSVRTLESRRITWAAKLFLKSFTLLHSQGLNLRTVLSGREPCHPNALELNSWDYKWPKNDIYWRVSSPPPTLRIYLLSTWNCLFILCRDIWTLRYVQLWLNTCPWIINLLLFLILIKFIMISRKSC